MSNSLTSPPETTVKVMAVLASKHVYHNIQRHNSEYMI